MAFGTSPAAEFQALQTRAKIASTLWSRAVLTVILGWIALTIWVVWHQTDSYRPWVQHAYFVRWIFCGIINNTPLLNRLAPSIPVPANGAWYSLPAFGAWLDSPSVYGRSFYSWYWHAATGNYGLGTELLPVALCALLVVWRVRRDPEGTRHIRGLRLIMPREHNRALHGGSLKRAIYGQPRGTHLGKSIIPEHMECEHFLITGSPGSGKSTLFRIILQQIAARLRRAIVIDRESEFVREFYNEERGDIILNPLDRRCPFWSPWSELRDEWFPVDAAAMAASIVRGRPRDENQRFFFESTRTVIEAILDRARDEARPNRLMELVSLPREELHQALKDTPAFALVDAEAHDQGAGILGTAVNAIKRFSHLPSEQRTTRKWSAREWVESGTGWVFLPSREDLHESIAPLQGMWLDLLIRWLLCPDEATGLVRGEHTWLLGDELASLGHQPQIEKAMTRGRKRELAIVLGVQNVSQIDALYGHDGRTTITSAPTTKVILRVDETETAKWASELIGSHEIERLQLTQLAGLSTYREGLNLSPHRSIEPLVLPDQIKLLQPFTGYLCVAGSDRTTIQIPKTYMIMRQPALLRWETPPTKSPDAEPKQPTEAEVIAQMKERVLRPAPAAEISDG